MVSWDVSSAFDPILALIYALTPFFDVRRALYAVPGLPAPRSSAAAFRFTCPPFLPTARARFRAFVGRLVPVLAHPFARTIRARARYVPYGELASLVSDPPRALFGSAIPMVCTGIFHCVVRTFSLEGRP